MLRQIGMGGFTKKNPDIPVAWSNSMLSASFNRSLWAFHFSFAMPIAKRCCLLSSSTCHGISDWRRQWLTRITWPRGNRRTLLTIHWMLNNHRHTHHLYRLACWEHERIDFSRFYFVRYGWGFVNHDCQKLALIMYSQYNIVFYWAHFIWIYIFTNLVFHHAREAVSNWLQSRRKALLIERCANCQGVLLFLPFRAADWQFVYRWQENFFVISITCHSSCNAHEQHVSSLFRSKVNSA